MTANRTLPECDSCRCTMDRWIGSSCRECRWKWCSARTETLAAPSAWAQYSSFGPYYWHLPCTPACRTTAIYPDCSGCPRTFAIDLSSSYRSPPAEHSVERARDTILVRQFFISSLLFGQLTLITVIASCKLGSSCTMPARSVWACALSSNNLYLVIRWTGLMSKSFIWDKWKIVNWLVVAVGIYILTSNLCLSFSWISLK